MKIKNQLSAFSAAILILTCTISLQAQDILGAIGGFEVEDANLKKLKSFGLMEEYSNDWFAATTVPADIFGEGAKGDKVDVPKNDYGTQEASKGSFYAGFRAYSKDPKLKRNYLEVKLPNTLKKDVMYCVSFDISLADKSRYAVNEIGVVLSDRKIEQPNDGVMSSKVDIKQKTNKVFQYMEGWEKFCGTFLGTGEEEYIIIGGFGERTKMKVEKIKRPNTLANDDRQISHAYYFIDNVSIVPIVAKSECKCTQSDERDMDLVYGSSSVMGEDMSDAEKVEASVVYYAFLKRTPTEAGKTTINSIIEILKANPEMSIKIIGHCDADEKNEGVINTRYASFGEKRATQVSYMFEDAGIQLTRISVIGMSDMDGATSLDTEISRARNRRVTFELK